jgi:hypothetical protein
LKPKEMLSKLPVEAYLALFVGITIICLILAYVFNSEANAVARRITSRQGELAKIVALKNVYVSKKQALVKEVPKEEQKHPLSLALIEETVSKTLVSGNLKSLKPTVLKDEKGKTEQVIEVKVSGVALGDGISFVKSIDSSGLHLKKFQLFLPQNQMLLDLYAVIGER